jgi:hypothetical protein
MVKHPTRERCVNELRQCARDCNVDLIGATSGRVRVAKFVAAIQSSDGSASSKRQAAKVYEEYLGTFDDEASAAVDTETPRVSVPVRRPLRLRGVSFLFTYNWDFFGKPLPDKTGAVGSARDLWSLWRTWKVNT